MFVVFPLELRCILDTSGCACVWQGGGGVQKEGGKPLATLVKLGRGPGKEGKQGH